MVNLTRTPGLLSSDHRVLFGAFGETTEAVIDRTQAIERSITSSPLVVSYEGLTVCAPVAAQASQAQILRHFEWVLDATTSNLAIYRLPQVVKCEIEPETFAALAHVSPGITLCKDTSGQDRIAEPGCGTGRARLLRGSEEGYAGNLKSLWAATMTGGF